MRVLKNLNIKKSIKSQRLVFEESWFDKIDRFMVYFIFSSGFITPFFVYFDPYREVNNTGFEYYLLFVLSLFCGFVIYRKFTELKLVKIKSDYSFEENKELIIKHFESKGFDLRRKAKQLMVFNSENDFSLSSNYQTSRIFIFNENEIYFAMIKSNFRLNVPVLFSFFFVLRDLKKMLLLKNSMNKP